MNRVVVSCLMLIVSMAARSDEPLRESVCAFTVTAPEGGFRIVPSKTLEVLHQVVSTDVFTLPADAPQHVASVMCARSSPIPVLNDMAVVKAGYPLFITAPATSGPPRVFALESDQSVYRLRAIRGQLAPAEQTAVEAILQAMNAPKESTGEPQT